MDSKYEVRIGVHDPPPQNQTTIIIGSTTSADRGGLYINNGDPMQTATAIRTAAVSLGHYLSALPK